MSETDFMAIVYQAYVGSLFIIGSFAIFHKGSDFRAAWERIMSIAPMRRTAVVLIANWVINTAFVITTKIYDPWFWFIAVDATAAAIVLHQPAGKPQSLIGGLYMAQIVMHCVYGVLELSGQAIAENSYWLVLIALAFVQLVVLGGWSGVHHGGRLARHIRRGRRTALARPASKKGMVR